MSLVLKFPRTSQTSRIPKIGRLEVRSDLNLGKSRHNIGQITISPDLARSRPISPDLPQISGSPHTSNARPARSGSSYDPIRPHRPLRHACRPARTAERHKRHPNGPSAAATAEDRTDRTRSAHMTGSPPKLPAPTRPPNSSRSCIRRTADKLSRSHQLTTVLRTYSGGATCEGTRTPPIHLL